MGLEDDPALLPVIIRMKRLAVADGSGQQPLRYRSLDLADDSPLQRTSAVAGIIPHPDQMLASRIGKRQSNLAVLQPPVSYTHLTLPTKA